MTGEPHGARAVTSARAAKDALRLRLDARRTAGLPNGDRTPRALELCAGCQVVAAYASLPGEPETWNLIEALAARGIRILLPVLTREPDWAWYAGPDQLATSWRGIRQPTGPRLGASALAAADWVWVPGLAGTPTGERLGTGGGWYDRALPHAAPATPVGLLLFDGEVLDAVPTDPWDCQVDWILTASTTMRTE